VRAGCFGDRQPGNNSGMDLSDTGTTVSVIAGIAIAVGVVGVVIPVVPGLLLSWLGVLFWALAGGGFLLRRRQA